MASMRNVKMIVELLILLNCFKLILSAIMSSEAMPSENAHTMFFTAIFYTMEDIPSDDNPYPVLRGHCTGALIAERWIITSKQCLVTLHWKVAVGISKFFKHNVHHRYNFKIVYIVDSIDTNIKLVQTDRAVRSAKPITIHPFSFVNARCYAALWMNSPMALSRDEEELGYITKLLEGHFSQRFGKTCGENETNITSHPLTEAILCLYQKYENDPVRLCSTDLGAPYVCDGHLVGVINDSIHMRCTKRNNSVQYPVTILSPHTTWINYFTGLEEYIELSLACLISPIVMLIIGLIVVNFLIL